jgi:hypothetical protein
MLALLGMCRNRHIPRMGCDAKKESLLSGGPISYAQQYLVNAQSAADFQQGDYRRHDLATLRA